MTTCENYEVYSHQQIWHEMHDGAGPSSQADAVAGWHELAERLTRIRHYLDSAVSGVQESQQGVAADAAVGAMVPLAVWVDEAQRLANDTRDRIDHQVSGFTAARNSIPEVPPEPRGWSWQDLPVIDGVTTSDQEADEAFNAEQQQQARAVMMAYQNGSNERVGNLAEFVSPPTGQPDLTIPPVHRSTIGALPGSGGDGPGAGSAVPGVSTPPAEVGGNGAVASPDAPPGAPAAAEPTGPQSGGGPGGAEHPGGRPVPATPMTPGGVAPGAPAVVGGSRVPGSGGGGSGGAAGMRGGPVRGGFGSSGGRGPGVGRVGPERGAGGFGPIGSPGSPVVRNPAGMTGAGRVSGMGTAGGTVPFGAMGTGVGRGGADHERRRPSYLIEPDSTRLIGELPLTAPPVIGEDPPDHNQDHKEPSRG